AGGQGLNFGIVGRHRAVKLVVLWRRVQLGQILLSNWDMVEFGRGAEVDSGAHGVSSSRVQFSQSHGVAPIGVGPPQDNQNQRLWTGFAFLPCFLKGVAPIIAFEYSLEILQRR